MIHKDKPVIMGILRHTPEFKPSEVIVAQELIDCYLNDPLNSGYYILVAEADSALMGYVCYGPTPLTEGTWDIYWAAVASDKRRLGIGNALFEAAEKIIRASQGRLAIIETSSTPEYAATRDFHAHNGYETIACIPDFYAPGDDKLILQKRMR